MTPAAFAIARALLRQAREDCERAGPFDRAALRRAWGHALRGYVAALRRAREDGVL